MTPLEIAKLAESFETKSPMAILKDALSRFGSDCAISFSGAEDVVLIDMAAQIGLPFRVFSLDTGRLHPETLRFIDDVRRRYSITIDVWSPNGDAVRQLVQQKGLFSFFDDGHQECCGVRKVAPLRRALSGLRAWVTGQRRDQSPTRTDVPTIQLDPVFEGAAGPLIKFNPLATWSSRKVWGYIRAQQTPHNTLHQRGFVSIGCEPCTRAILPGQHEREGRWWWEESTQKECGLHSKD